VLVADAVSVVAGSVLAMRYGFVVPFPDAREFTRLASLGERHGWDGVFTWEALFGEDAWVVLGATAMVTERIRLGTLLTPVARHRPWDLASSVGTVDRLSNGRAIVGAGLGALHDGWTAFEADEGRRVRAEKLDEGLAIYAGLLRGQPFAFDGKHFSARPTDFMLPPPPVQQSHPPVWVVGAYVPGRERQPSLERAARWNGLLPSIADRTRPEGAPPYTLDSFTDLVGRVRTLRESAGLPWKGYDVVVEADSSGEFVQLEGTPADWEQAGGTWWVESWWSLQPGPDGLAELRRRIEAGPPRV
jgi:alkanesulfonate monooxygenase SsuD/methylene tetrahydromethanopterin reductase-like flavin-dependent oxidoreductase (luciferase family)